MQYIYTALFTPIEDGSGYYAKVPDLPGCITTGNSLSDAINQITDAMNAWLVVAEDECEPIAPPIALYCARFVLKLNMHVLCKHLIKY